MKKIRLNLQDLLSVLEALSANGTEDVIIFEHSSGYPAIVDEARLY